MISHHRLISHGIWRPTLLGLAARSAADCVVDLNLALLQDGSGSFMPLISDMVGKASALFDDLSAKFDSVRMGVATFTDKPTPFRGVGGGRGYPKPLDFCYRKLTPHLLSESAELGEAFKLLLHQTGHGGDGPEDPYEALIHLVNDEDFWTLGDHPSSSTPVPPSSAPPETLSETVSEPLTVPVVAPTGGELSDSSLSRAMARIFGKLTHSSGDLRRGRGLGQQSIGVSHAVVNHAAVSDAAPIALHVDVVITVTDDLPHLAGDAAAGVLLWDPAPPAPSVDPRAAVHFYDSKFYDADLIYGIDMPPIYDGDSQNKGRYQRLVELHKDKNEDNDEYRELMRILGPAVWPTPLTFPKTPADIKAAQENCEKFEYPSLSDVGDALKRRPVIPIFLVAEPSLVSTESRRECAKYGFVVERKNTTAFVECITGVYTQQLAQLNIPYYAVMSFSYQEDEFIQIIVDVVDKVVGEVDCSGAEDPVPPDDDNNNGGGDDTGEGAGQLAHKPRMSAEEIVGLTCAAVGGGALLVLGVYFLVKSHLLREEPDHDLGDVTEFVEMQNSIIDRDVTQLPKVDMFRFSSVQ